MATYRKRGKTWRVEVARKGAPRQSETFATKAAAERWATELEAAIAKGDRPLAETKTLGDALRRFKLEVAPKHKGERWESIRLAKLERELGCAGMLLADLTPADFTTWRERMLKGDAKADPPRRPMAPPSVRREMGLLRQVLGVARREWGWIRHNPLEGVERPQSAPARDRIYTSAEVDAIVLALGYRRGNKAVTSSQRTAVGFLLSLESAMRAGEIVGLEWSRINTAERYAMLPATKNGDARKVPLSAAALELLEALPRVEGQASVFALNARSRDTLFRRARDNAGVRNAHFHDARATALTRFAQVLDVLELARLAGHRDPRSLMIYYRATPATIADKLDRLTRAAA